MKWEYVKAVRDKADNTFCPQCNDECVCLDTVEVRSDQPLNYDTDIIKLKWVLVCEADPNLSSEIFYCPMCGHKLPTVTHNELMKGNENE